MTASITNLCRAMIIMYVDENFMHEFLIYNRRADDIYNYIYLYTRNKPGPVGFY